VIQHEVLHYRESVRRFLPVTLGVKVETFQERVPNLSNRALQIRANTAEREEYELEYDNLKCKKRAWNGLTGHCHMSHARCNVTRHGVVVMQVVLTQRSAVSSAVFNGVLSESSYKT
jgi:hypothetical protein